MSHHHAAQPEKHGAGSKGHAPQVAVRDGNRLLCPCCGEVLLVLPEKPASYGASCQAVAIDPEIAAHEFPADPPPPIPNRRTTRLRPESLDPREPRERDEATRARERELYRSKRPLREPLTYEAARLFAYTFYRLQALNRQLHREICEKQEEIDQLQRELDGLKETSSPEEGSPSKTLQKVVAHRETKQAITPRRRERVRHALQRHAQADLGVAPGRVHEASMSIAVEKTKETSEAHERGPP
ncbi:hypothetical protein [Bremerella sp. P1]|uniref:hypothetical protein n=1 Tax=Bremerella sp. P1 TaxID=3026424 RepID=UPI002367DF01|nr:hypothetical protein [Bremerella sp. P1]WDI43212.1 hypothetical protein PSR63_04540 [Bremerella sp. P1]